MAVYGGTPWRLLRLTATGADLARRLLGGAPVDDPAAAALGRRLVDAGLAHARPPRAHGAAEVSMQVIVPAYGRPDALDRCLRALGDGLPVLVVDDGSPDAGAVAAVVRRHRARLLRREVNGGPGAARNAGLAAASADVAAFVDSDVQVGAGSLRALARHLADADVVAVAPRVRPRRSGGSWLERFAAGRSPLDLGSRPAVARAGGPVGYVPSTVLLVRRPVLAAAGGFRRGAALRRGRRCRLAAGRGRRVGALRAVRCRPS